MKSRDYFFTEVIRQIKSKEAGELVKAELSFHVENAKKDWMEQGWTEAEAEEKAVKDMGSPARLGRELNKLHRPKVDWLLIGLLAAALMLGFLPVLSMPDSGHYLMNKAVFVLLGSVATVGLMLIDYRKLERYGWLFYLIGAGILLCLRFFPNTMINGEPFLRIGPATIECFMALPFFFLAWGSFFNQDKINVWKYGLLFLLSLYLFFSIPNLSAVFIYTLMVFVMLWQSRIGKKQAIFVTAFPAVLTAAGSAFLWAASRPYQRERFLGFLHPEQYESSTGYFYLQLKKMFSSASWFGAPEGTSVLPEAHTNFVFAGMMYQYGYLLAGILALILSCFVVRMIMITVHIKDSYGKQLLAGGAALYGVQFLYHIAMSFGLLPITTMSLPFISYGLMPALLHSFIIGVVLSVYRRKNLILQKID